VANWTKWAALAAWGTVVVGVVSLYLTYTSGSPAKQEQSFSLAVKAPGNASREALVNFVVKQCTVAPKLVSCVLNVVSPLYDRNFYLTYYQTMLVDGVGDTFRETPISGNLLLERDQTFTFKVEFVVNKDIVRPAKITLAGRLDSSPFQKSFDVK
jgi:hypothetical protein